MSEALIKAERAKAAARAWQGASAADRSRAIEVAAAAIDAARQDILAANARDMERARANNTAPSLLDRLLLDEARITSIVASMREVAAQADPLGVVLGGRTLACGVKMEQVRVPLGVVAIIYEARPNVTADSVALCLRSGNACVLRGGAQARESASAMAAAARAGLAEAGFDAELVQYIESPDRQEAVNLMHADGLVDVLIPRGGAGLISTCVREASVPVIETGTGNCHIYLEESADLEMAINIVLNAKTSRPGVCNAAESLLIDASALDRLLIPVLSALADAGVELVGSEEIVSRAKAAGLPITMATPEDYGTEYLALKMSVAAVEDTAAAINHINTYGTGHSECIVTQNYEAAETFLALVDAAAVYVNASTRFSDGGVFGLGAEIGISTQKLHARGPMGADALTSTKYLLRGSGQVR